MKRKVLAIMLCMGMLTVSLMGCGKAKSSTAENTTVADKTDTQKDVEKTNETKDNSDASKKVTLRFAWWGNQVRNDLTSEVVNLYMEQNPNIKIDIEFTDYGSYWDKMSVEAAGGELPDIFQLDYGYLGNYQSSGQLADLSSFIENGTLDTSKINSTVIESATVDGGVYGIASGSTAYMMDYDVDTVEKANVIIPDQLTIDELYNIGEQVYQATGIGTFWDSSTNALSMIARMNGKFYIDQIKEGDDSSIREHLEYVKKFADAEFAISPDILAEKNWAVVETKPINDLTTWNDFSYANQFVAISNSVGRELGMTMYPTKDNAVNNPEFVQPAAYLGVPESSENKEEAAKFINWFVNSTDCNDILKGERGTPVNSEVASKLASESDEITKQVYDFMASVQSVATPVDPLFSDGKAEIDALNDSIVESLRRGEIDVDEASSSFMEQAQAILKSVE